MKKTKTRQRGKRAALSTIHTNAAGIDVGSRFHVVAVPVDRDDEPVRTFQSLPANFTVLLIG